MLKSQAQTEFMFLNHKDLTKKTLFKDEVDNVLSMLNFITNISLLHFEQNRNESGI